MLVVRFDGNIVEQTKLINRLDEVCRELGINMKIDSITKGRDDK